MLRAAVRRPFFIPYKIPQNPYNFGDLIPQSSYNFEDYLHFRTKSDLQKI